MSEPSTRKSLLIIGASRGLGYALTQEYLRLGWRVLATGRRDSLNTLLALMSKSSGQLEVGTVDMNLPDEVAALHARLRTRQFDLLIINAGVKNADHETIADVATEEFTRVMVTNALSPMRLLESFQDLITPTGTIGIMSSGQGSVANNTSGGYEVYRASKAALNTLMRSFAARHAADQRSLLLLAPGWVRTDMGGPNARLSIEESIPNLVRTIAAQQGRPGLQYLDYLGRAVPW